MKPLTRFKAVNMKAQGQVIICTNAMQYKYVKRVVKGGS